MPLPPGALSLGGHQGDVDSIAFLSDQSRIVTGCRDGKARVFNAKSGEIQITFTEHCSRGCHAHIVGMAVLGPDLIASVDSSGFLCAWRPETGECLYREKQHVGGLPTSRMAVSALSSTRFVVGSCEGRLIFFHHRDGKDIFENGSVRRAHTECIRFMSTHGRRMVTASGGKKAKVWDVGTKEVRIREIATLSSHEETVRGVAIDAKHVVTTTGDGSQNIRGGVYIWDALKFSLLRKIDNLHKDWINPPIILDSNHILTVSEDRSIVVTDFSKGTPVHRFDSNFRVWQAATSRDGCIAACGGKKSVVVFPVPQSIAPVIRSHADSTIAPSLVVAVVREPLTIKKVFFMLRDGRIGAGEAVAKALNPAACAVSLSEFFYAHEIFMVAVKHGGVPGRTSFDFVGVTPKSNEGKASKTTRKIGGRNWWFENVYLSASKLQLSEQAMRLVKFCIAEAAEAGILETTEVAVFSIVARKDLRQEAEIVQSAGIQICRMLADIQVSHHILGSKQSALEGSLDVNDRQLKGLPDSFSRFQRERAIVHLIGFCLHLLPFGGGALTELVTGSAAFADVCKDLCGAALGMDGERRGMQCDKILACAGDTLENLDSEKNGKLVKILAIKDVGELQRSFKWGRAQVGEVGESRLTVDLAAEFELVIHQLSSVLVKKQPKDPGGGSGTKSRTAKPDFAALKLKRKGVKTGDVKRMMDKEIVELIAGDLVSFNPRHAKRFEEIKVSLTKALKKLDVYAGRDLFGENACVSSKSFLRVILEHLKRDGLVGATTEERLKRFILSVTK